MVSSVTESLIQAAIFLLSPSLVTDAEERRDHYGQSGH
mgnify:CR=1 FL=1|jgi:hypothetical protein